MIPDITDITNSSYILYFTVNYRVIPIIAIVRLIIFSFQRFHYQ